MLFQFLLMVIIKVEQMSVCCHCACRKIDLLTSAGEAVKWQIRLESHLTILLINAKAHKPKSPCLEHFFIFSIMNIYWLSTRKEKQHWGRHHGEKERRKERSREKDVVFHLPRWERIFFFSRENQEFSFWHIRFEMDIRRKNGVLWSVFRYKWVRYTPLFYSSLLLNDMAYDLVGFGVWYWLM